jgi:acyl carrier protein
MDTRLAIRQLIADLLRQKGDLEPFADSDSLLLSGWLQSLDALELIVFLEENYGIDFANRPFNQNIIDSVERVLELVAPAN